MLSDKINNRLDILPINFTGTTGRGKPDFALPSAISAKSTLNEILAFARSKSASDVHLGALKPVIFRQYGSFKVMTEQLLEAAQLNLLITDVLPKDVLDQFEQTGDVEFVHAIPGYGRFRIAMMKQQNGLDLTARVIPMDIPSFEDTGMPASCADLTKWAQGLVLITGPAGCGKTTTLATLVEMINRSRYEHIICIEDPIEIIYEPKNCQITQREINTHTFSQATALSAALREDPDIIVVSELRDLDNIQLAVTASETGHLVFGTMNTVNAAQTISLLVDSFPAEEQNIIRNMISESLRGVICQQLVPRSDGAGVVPAYEILIVNTSVANLIRKNKISQINNAITTSRTSGMVLMDESLKLLVSRGIISRNEACERALTPGSI